MPDVLVDSATTPELLETQVSHELVSEVEALQVLEQATLEVVVETQTTTELVDATEASLLIEVAVQGPPGAQGPAGPPGPPGSGGGNELLVAVGKQGVLVGAEEIATNYTNLS